MDNLIDRSELIKCLHNTIFMDGDNRSLVYRIIEQQPCVRTQSYSWISCEDILPQENRTVACITVDGVIRLMQLDGVWFEKLHRYELSDVKYWTPLPELPKQNETSCWIRCVDRMPEISQSVLIYAGKHRVSAYWDSVKNVFRLTEDENLYYIPEVVTHWMPMPESPEECE